MGKMLDAVRLSLRVTGDTFDQEIIGLIESCKADLRLAGVVKIKNNDPLILRAVTLYAKGHFGFANMGEKYLEAYTSLKIHLQLAGDYTGV
jgi:hypothetical protein